MDRLASSQRDGSHIHAARSAAEEIHHHEEISSIQQCDENSLRKLVSKSIKYHIFHVAFFSTFFNILLFSSPIYMLQIYNRILPARAEEALVNITLLVVFTLLIMGILDAVRQLILVKLAYDIENKISQQALSAVLAPPRRNDETSDYQPVLRDIDQIRSLLTKGHLLHVFDVLWLPGFLVALALLHPYLAVVALVGVIILCALGTLSHSVIAPSTRKANCSALQVFSIADQMIAKADVLRGLGMMSTMIRRWDGMRQAAAADHLNASQQLGLLTASSKVIKVTFQSMALGVGAYLAIHDAVSAGAIVAGSILISRVLSPIEAAILAGHELLNAWNSHQRLARLRGDNRLAPSHTVMAPSTGNLVVEHLSYTIDGRSVLRDVSFEAKPGQLVAIIGPSGSGKTTLAKFLVGAWACSGAVRLDGLDTASMTDDAKQRFVGYLPQEGHLFGGTIMETISRFGAPTAERILETTELVGIHDMILRLPNDYGAAIGNDGCLLSGGQRQKLALARALYGNPALVVLDEPCAHLDEVSERRLIKTVQAVKDRKSTVCLITHKLNFLHLADSILVLNAKGQARFGSPRDLFSTKPRAVPSRAS